MKDKHRDIEKDAGLKVETVKVTNDNVRKLYIMICDDQEEHILHLRQLLEQLQEDIDLQITADTSPEKFLCRLENLADAKDKLPDIIFLDIKMPETDGIALGKSIHMLAPESYLIFTTAYEEYAVEGYEAQAFRYLLKPLTEEMVQRVVTDIRKDMCRKKKLLIRLANEEMLLPLKDILYLSAEDKYTVIYTAEGYYLDRTSLTGYESLLTAFGFYRIHRKYIVNVLHHRSIGKGFVTLSHGIRLPISRRRETAYHTALFNGLEKELLR